MSDELERTGSMGDNLVDIKGLSVSFVTDAGPIKAIAVSISPFPARPWWAWSANPAPANR